MVTTKPFKLLEFGLIFFGLPFLFLLQIIPLFAIMPVLWVVSFYVVYTIKKVNPSKLFDVISFSQLKPIVIRFIFIAPFLLGFTYIFHEKRLFSFILMDSTTYIMIMFLYPLLSVIPQEVIFRKFFFDRYSFSFTPAVLIVINALIFGWVHIVFENTIAVLFSIVGGYLFAQTYLRSRSFTLVVIEHALYGNLLFTIGLGEFFYHGAVQ